MRVQLKRPVRMLAVAAMLLLLLCGSAFAASPVSVQLDGAAIDFTDAAPQIVSDRTFLPFRAVFEQMGATVGYNKGVVTAERDGKTVTMTIGSTEASITENGVTLPLTMDVAPFIDANLGRTYVPVRFAAQAMGANVGWDADDRTVIIVDTEKLVDKALEGKTFTYLDKLNDFSEKFNAGTWKADVSMTGKVDADLTSLELEGVGKISIPVTIAASGISEDGKKVQMNESFTADLNSVKPLLASFMGEDAEIDKLIKGLADHGFGIDIRGDLTTGKLYMHLDLSALDESLAASDWYLIDLNSLTALSGIDFDELMSLAGAADTEKLYRSTLTASLSTVELDDKDSGFTSVSSLVSNVITAFSDSGFVKNGDVYTCTFEDTFSGTAAKAQLVLTMKDDKVVSYQMTMDSAFNAAGMSLGTMHIDLTTDEKGTSNGTLKLDITDLATADFTIKGTTEKSTAAPIVTPPEGATITDYNALLNANPLE